MIVSFPSLWKTSWDNQLKRLKGLLWLRALEVSVCDHVALLLCASGDTVQDSGEGLFIHFMVDREKAKRKGGLESQHPLERAHPQWLNLLPEALPPERSTTSPQCHKPVIMPLAHGHLGDPEKQAFALHNIFLITQFCNYLCISFLLDVSPLKVGTFICFVLYHWV